MEIDFNGQKNLLEMLSLINTEISDIPAYITFDKSESSNTSITDKKIFFNLDPTKEEIKEKEIENQINSVKESRITASKLCELQLLTGQGYKIPMDIEVTKLTETLYNATNIDVKNLNNPEEEKGEEKGEEKKEEKKEEKTS